MLLPLLIVGACTKYNIIDTGTIDPNYEFSGNMYEYLQADDYNWDLTVQVIDRAGVADVFKGTDANYTKITFFGPTSHSIRRYLLDRGYVTDGVVDVSLVDPEVCKELIMSHVVDGLYMREDIPDGVRSPNFGEAGEGGIIFTGETVKDVNDPTKSQFWAYTYRGPYEGIPDIGPSIVGILSFNSLSTATLASLDNKCSNGVVHSMQYDFTFGNL